MSTPLNTMYGDDEDDDHSGCSTSGWPLVEKSSESPDTDISKMEKFKEALKRFFKIFFPYGLPFKDHRRKLCKMASYIPITIVPAIITILNLAYLGSICISFKMFKYAKSKDDFEIQRENSDIDCNTMEYFSILDFEVHPIIASMFLVCVDFVVCYANYDFLKNLTNIRTKNEARFLFSAIHSSIFVVCAIFILDSGFNSYSHSIIFGAIHAIIHVYFMWLAVNYFNEMQNT